MFNLIARVIRDTGALGVFLLMLIENVVPGIPSEVIMPMAGYDAATGHLSAFEVVATGTAGSVLGALSWYGLGRWIGLQRLLRWSERHGRWLTLTPDELRRADAWFRRYGSPAGLTPWE